MWKRDIGSACSDTSACIAAHRSTDAPLGFWTEISHYWAELTLSYILLWPHCRQVRSSPSLIFCLFIALTTSSAGDCSKSILLIYPPVFSWGLVSYRFPLVQLIAFISTLGHAMTLNKFHNHICTLRKLDFISCLLFCIFLLEKMKNNYC